MVSMQRRNPYIKTWQDLAIDKNMLFLARPRQAGKTTLTQIISGSFAMFSCHLPKKLLK
jgi:predicted AAA+ superfamily ATPase